MDFISCEGETGYVLKIEVQKSSDIKKTADEKIFIRKGAQNLPVKTNEELNRLKLNKGIFSFEDQTTQAITEDISKSLSVSDFIAGVVPDVDPAAWLKKTTAD